MALVPRPAKRIEFSIDPRIVEVLTQEIATMENLLKTEGLTEKQKEELEYKIDETSVALDDAQRQIAREIAQEDTEQMNANMRLGVRVASDADDRKAAALRASESDRGVVDQVNSRPPTNLEERIIYDRDPEEYIRLRQALVIRMQKALAPRDEAHEDRYAPREGFGPVTRRLEILSPEEYAVREEQKARKLQEEEEAREKQREEEARKKQREEEARKKQKEEDLLASKAQPLVARGKSKFK